MKKLLTRMACLLLTLLIPQQGIAGKIIYVHTDLLGSPIAETDQNGNVLWRKPSIPSAITVPIGIDTDGIYTVHWAASTAVTSYQLIESINSGSWSAPSSLNTLNKSYAGKGNGTYRYGIRACNSSGCSGYRYSSTFTVLLKPSSPALVTVPASDYDGSYTISWSTAGTATRYELLERVNSGSWKTLSSNATLTSFNRSGLVSGTYQYAVRACNATGCSVYSYSRILINVLMPSVVSVPLIDVDGNYTISWGGVSTRSRYVVQEKAGSGGWTTLSSTTTSTSITLNGRANNTYQYRVAACNSGGCSSYRYSAIVTVTKSPTSITYASKDHDGAFSVSWAGVSTATSYQLQQQLGNGSWSTIYTGNATNTALSGRADGNYKYRIRACKGSTCSGYRTGNYIRVIRPNLHLDWDKNYVESIGLNGRIRWTANGADYCKMSYSDPYIPVAPNRSSSGNDYVSIVRNTTATMTCYFGGLSITRTSFIYVKNTNIILEF